MDVDRRDELAPLAGVHRPFHHLVRKRLVVPVFRGVLFGGQPGQYIGIAGQVDAVILRLPQQGQQIVQHGVAMLAVSIVEETLQARYFFAKDLIAQGIPFVNMPLLWLHEKGSPSIPHGLTLRREQSHGIFAVHLFGRFFQFRRFFGRKPDGIVVVKNADAGTQGQRPAGKCGKLALDALGGLQNVIPCAHQKNVVAACVDDGHLQPLQNVVDVALEEQRHLPGERRRAGQGDVMHPPNRVALSFLLEAGNEGLAEVVYIHSTHRNAVDALGLVGQLFHLVAGGIVAHIQVGAVGQSGKGCIFCVNPHNVLCTAQPHSGCVHRGQGQVFLPSVQCGQRAGIRLGRHAADHEHRLFLDFTGKLHEHPTPWTEVLVQVGAGAAHLAFPPVRVGSRVVQLPQIVRGIAVEFVLLQQAVHPAEQLFVRAAFGGGVGQVVAGAGAPGMGQKQLGAELLPQPAVEAAVPLGQHFEDGGGVGQKHIAVPAAGVDHIGAGDAAPGQKFVQIMLQKKFQKERPAAQRAQSIFGVNRVEKLLNAGEICGVKKKNVQLAEVCFLLKQRPAQVRDAVCLHIAADAGGHGRRCFGVIVEGDVRAFAGAGAGGEPAELGFQQPQQRVDPFGLRQQFRQALLQFLHCAAIKRGRKRLQLLRQAQLGVLWLRGHYPAGMGSPQVGEHRIQRQIPPELGTLALDLPPVGRCREVVGQVHDPGRGG